MRSDLADDAFLDCLPSVEDSFIILVLGRLIGTMGLGSMSSRARKARIGSVDKNCAQQGFLWCLPETQISAELV